MKIVATPGTKKRPHAGSDVPRLGFLGVGWIGRNRMEAIAASGFATVAAIADAVPDVARAAAEGIPGARVADGLDALLDADDLEGVVIATPSALHAEQAIRALERGRSVFCQKPLGRDAAESARVVDAARAADRLLAVDLSYRFTRAAIAVRDLVRSGELGRIHAVDLTFHNAWGPDKAWFHDPRLAGGGCVVDLGIHLVDLLHWVGGARVERVTARLHAKGASLPTPRDRVEDFASAQLVMSDGSVARLACSWWLSAGQDCAIEAAFFGTAGAAWLRNVGGSFYDFRAESARGTTCRTLVEPPDAWGGRAAVAWAERLARGERAFDPEVESVIEVARVLDRIYLAHETGRDA